MLSVKCQVESDLMNTILLGFITVGTRILTTLSPSIKAVLPVFWIPHQILCLPPHLPTSSQNYNFLISYFNKDIWTCTVMVQMEKSQCWNFYDVFQELTLQRKCFSDILICGKVWICSKIALCLNLVM